MRDSDLPGGIREGGGPPVVLTAVAVFAGAFAGGFAYASFFEWTLHRFLMHRPLVIRYPFRTHALTHHRLFRADESYHLLRPEDAKKISFAPWNAPVLIALQVPLFWAVGRWTGLPVVLPAVLAVAVYYGLYESLHYCMHVPKGRWIERTAPFRWLTAHHRAHHQRHDRNLNVVLPLADFLFRTLHTWKPDAQVSTAGATPSPLLAGEERLEERR